jgi:HD-like signal output (HDOD) protein
MLTSPDAARSPITREKLLRQAQALPAAPQVMGGLCELLEDVNAGLDEVADQIRLDPALAARVMRLSNSTIFGGGEPVSSIDEAVTRVGFTEITRLVGIATVAGLADRALQVYAIPAERMRESLLLHALAGEELARATSIEPRSAYALGLLRGVGMMVLDRVARGNGESTEVFDPSAFVSYVDWERARFGLSNSEVTSMVLDEWRFPHDLVVATEQHLTPADDVLANVLNLAGAIVAIHGLALPGEERLWELTPEKFAAASIDEETWQQASDRAHEVFMHQRQALY